MPLVNHIRRILRQHEPQGVSRVSQIVVENELQLILKLMGLNRSDTAVTETEDAHSLVPTVVQPSAADQQRAAEGMFGTAGRVIGESERSVGRVIRRKEVVAG